MDGAARFRPNDVVMAVGRPVLVVPYAGTFKTVGKRSLVAWDGTREANRALNDALPLLADAQAVTVMFVGANEQDLEQHWPALERIVGHLQGHGVNATAEETMRGGLAISDILLSRAADLVADLIVMGGYHHSQLREALIGGVSRELLEHMTVPVLMSH
jgi:nucleotide-binding universal stress UspA family protein